MRKYRLNPIALGIGERIIERLENREYNENGLDFLKKFITHWERLGYDVEKYREVLNKYGIPEE